MITLFLTFSIFLQYDQTLIHVSAFHFVAQSFDTEHNKHPRHIRSNSKRTLSMLAGSSIGRDAILEFPQGCTLVSFLWGLPLNDDDDVTSPQILSTSQWSKGVLDHKSRILSYPNEK